MAKRDKFKTHYNKVYSTIKPGQSPRHRKGLDIRKGGKSAIKLIDRDTFMEGYRQWTFEKLSLTKFAAMCEVDRNTLRSKLEFFFRNGFMPEEWFYDKNDPESIAPIIVDENGNRIDAYYLKKFGKKDEEEKKDSDE